MSILSLKSNYSSGYLLNAAQSIWVLGFDCGRDTARTAIVFFVRAQNNPEKMIYNQLNIIRIKSVKEFPPTGCFMTTEAQITFGATVTFYNALNFVIGTIVHEYHYHFFE